MAVYHKDGTWKKVPKKYTKVNDSWKLINCVYVKVNGIWEAVHCAGSGGGKGSTQTVSPEIFWSLTQTKDANDVLDDGARPLNLQVQVGQDSDEAVLTWEVFSEDIVDHYDVFRADNSGGNFTEISGSDLTQKTYTDVVSDDNDKFYKVRGVTINGNQTQFSNEVKFIPPRFNSFGVSGDQLAAKINLTWDYIGGNYDVFQVLRAESSGGNFSEISRTSSQSYADEPPSSGTFYYKVKSLNSQDNSILTTSEESGTLNPTNEVYFQNIGDDEAEQYRLIGSNDASDYVLEASISYDKFTNWSNNFFKPDGTRMFFVHYDGQRELVSFDLTTPWIISTATNRQSQELPNNDIGIQYLWFKPDGTEIFLINDADGQTFTELYRVSLESAWDITSNITQISSNSSYNDRGFAQNSLTLSPDGSKVFISNPRGSFNPDYIKQWSLSTPFDITNMSFDHTFEFGRDEEIFDFQFSDNGNLLWIQTEFGKMIKNELNTPYDLSSGVTELNNYEEPSDSNFAAFFINEPMDKSP